MLNMNLIYLRLEWILSDVVLFQDSELSPIRRLGIDVLVKIDIRRLEFTSAEMLKKDI